MRLLGDRLTVGRQSLKLLMEVLILLPELTWRRFSTSERMQRRRLETGATNYVLVEQPGVLACLSRRRSRVQIPSRTLAARYANWLSGEAQTFVSAGSTPACATNWVVLSAAVCRTVVAKQAEWMTNGSIPSQPNYGPLVYRFRTPASHAGKAGSIPARVTRKF